MKLLFSTILSLIFILPICSFNHGPNKFNSKKDLKKFEKNYKFIPSGTLQMEDDKYTVNSFYMFSTEITNLQYQEFITDLQREGKKELLEKIKVKPSFWENESFEKTYHQHPAYQDYPVLNIDHDAALEYCKWLSGMLAKNYKIDLEKIEVRLPTLQEWRFAACAGRPMVPYPWGGYYLQNSKGCYLANFNKTVGAEYISKDEESGELVVVAPKMNAVALSPAPVESYFPNDYGLYNMSGNVAEMIMDKGIAMGGSWNSTGYDIRIDATYKYDNPNPYVGFRPVVIFSD